MARTAPRLVTSAPLSYLLSFPDEAPPPSGVWPVLCFLHGYDEGAPMPIERALMRHGPLAPTSAPLATEAFVVVAPQLPTRGDVWQRHADAVLAIVREVQAAHYGDAAQTFLTGFSFGGNGVFDLALLHPAPWAALWPVDPTRIPQRDPGLPVWLSSGEVSRRAERGFASRLQLTPPHGEAPGDRVLVDEGEDHVGTARRAYQDERIYRWLLARRRSA